MPFLLLLLLFLVCLGETWPRPGWMLGLSPTAQMAASAAFSTLAMLLPVLLAERVSKRIRRIIETGAWKRERVRHACASMRRFHLFFLLAAYGMTLYFLGWGWTAWRMLAVDGSRLPIGESGQSTVVLPGAELILLAPFLAALIGSWSCFYTAEKAVHDALSARPYWTRREYLTFHVQQNLGLLAVPLVILILSQGFFRLYPSYRYDQSFFLLAMLPLLAAVFIGMPWILRLVFGLRPLPPGPLRERLLAAARRLRFRCSDVLQWDTSRGVANAMVVGIFPIPRYVVLTDRLAADLSPEEVEAVFGHEVGHVKHCHIAYYLGFMMMSLLSLGAAFATLADWAGWEDSINLYPQLAILPLGAYIFVVFGFLSRRCEGQADIYGCRAVSCTRADCAGHESGQELPERGRGLCPTGIRTFIQALEKVAYLNGISRSRPGWLQSWQHSTIARRVDFLQEILADPGLERRFQRRVFLVKAALLLALASLLAALALV